MNSNDHFRDALSARRDAINDAIDERLPSHSVSALQGAVSHYLDFNTNRYQSVTLLLIAAALEHHHENHIETLPAALAVECTHAASLAHETANNKPRAGSVGWDIEDLTVDILAGDLLYALGYKFLQLLCPKNRSRVRG